MYPVHKAAHLDGAGSVDQHLNQIWADPMEVSFFSTYNVCTSFLDKYLLLCSVLQGTFQTTSS